MRTIAIAAAMLAATTSFASATSLQDAVAAVYKLHDNERANCSSVAVSPTQLVTAAHCLGSGDRPTIRVYNEGFDAKGKEWEVRSYSSHTLNVIRKNKQEDVAFLELMDDSIKLNPVEVADSYDPVIGDRVMAVGYPRTDELTLTEGLFTAIVAMPDLGFTGPFYKTTVPITGGSSGGALIRDFGSGDYKLIGLTSAGYRDVSFQNYFSTVEKVQNVIKNLIVTGDEAAVHESAPKMSPGDMAIDGRG